MTGSGKTTMAALVPRLQDATGGRVTLDGVDVRDIELASLRRHVGFAFEEPTLFSASVRDNLLLGFPDASDADVEEALAPVLRNATSLIVVHRPSTVALADRAALLHDGRIVAVGTHAELMENEDRYRAILSQEAEQLA
jgi:ABC-type multidrug transport system fused ATPase/permease subunit